jgi:molybdate transport system substrate-binding protein
MRLRILGFLFPAILLLAAAPCMPAQNGGAVLVSAAISLKDAFEEIGLEFEAQTGIRVQLNLGGSGLLQKQIEAGAPVDVYASAGMKQMDALESGGLIVQGTRRSFVRNSLVLIVPSNSARAIRSFNDLTRPDISKVAIGNPKTVPAGQYAEQTLKSLGIWDSLKDRLVPAGDVRQVLEYVTRGEVEAGIVYASDVPVSHGKTVIAASAPEDSHSPILYPIAIVKGTESAGAARKFVDFVTGASGQAIMKKYGFLPPR